MADFELMSDEPSKSVSYYVALMHDHLRHFNGHNPIERDCPETYGVLGTQIVRRKTDEILDKAVGPARFSR